MRQRGQGRGNARRPVHLMADPYWALLRGGQLTTKVIDEVMDKLSLRHRTGIRRVIPDVTHAIEDNATQTRVGADFVDTLVDPIHNVRELPNHSVRMFFIEIIAAYRSQLAGQYFICTGQTLGL